MESIFYTLIDTKNVEEKIVQGYQMLFPHRYTKETFNWEFVQVKGRSINVIAQDNQKDDKLICTQGHIPIGLKKGNQPYLSHKTVGNYLLPEYRGASIFTDLYKIGIAECIKDNSRLIWGFTPAVKVWRDNVGFNAIEKEIFEAMLFTIPPCT